LDEDEAPREIAFAPAGGLLAFRTWRGEVRLWDLQGKAPRQVASRPRHKEDKLGCLAFDPGEEGLVLLGAREVDPKQGKWQTSLLACKVDAGRGKIVEGQWFPGGEVQDDSSLAWPDAVVVSPSGRHLAFATSLDVHIWEWHGARRQQWAVLGGLGKRVNGAAFSPDGLELATCGSDYVDDGKNTGDWVERVWLWDLTGAQPRPRRGFDVSDVYRLDYALGGDALMVQEGRACVLRDKKTGKQLWRWQPPGGGTFAVVAPDRRHVALTNSNGTIYIVRLKEPDKP